MENGGAATVDELLDRISKLESRVTALEAKLEHDHELLERFDRIVDFREFQRKAVP